MWNQSELIGSFRKKLARQWKNSFIKRHQNTAYLNFPSPKLRVMLLFWFFEGDNSVSHCKTLAQLTFSYWKTEKNSSLKRKQRVTEKEKTHFKFAVLTFFFIKPFFHWAIFKRTIQKNSKQPIKTKQKTLFEKDETESWSAKCNTEPCWIDKSKSDSKSDSKTCETKVNS